MIILLLYGRSAWSWSNDSSMTYTHVIIIFYNYSEYCTDFDAGCMKFISQWSQSASTSNLYTWSMIFLALCSWTAALGTAIYRRKESWATICHQMTYSNDTYENTSICMNIKHALSYPQSLSFHSLWHCVHVIVWTSRVHKNHGEGRREIECNLSKFELHFWTALKIHHPVQAAAHIIGMPMPCHCFTTMQWDDATHTQKNTWPSSSNGWEGGSISSASAPTKLSTCM